MKLSSLKAARPVLFFIFLGLVVLIIPGVLIPWWYKTSKRLEHDVALDANNLYSSLLSQIESTAKLLYPMNSCATNLIRVISSSLNGSELSFSEIETKVAPSLFQALSIAPHMSQISYMGMSGLFFSYYIDNNQTLAVYSNSSSSLHSAVPNATMKWYTQPVDPQTGKLYGSAAIISPSSIDTSRFLEALNSTDGIASLGTGWNKARDPLFLNTAGIYGQGAVSLGFPVKAITNFFTGINLYGGSFFIATNDGTTLVEGLPNSRMIIANNSIYFQLMKPNNGERVSYGEYILCMLANGTFSTVSIGESEYDVYCSPLEIVGVKSVYALAMPHRGIVSLVHKTSKFALILIVVMVVSVLIAVFSSVIIMGRAAKKEMHLCASLIKQMDATQQAERKSMNKSLAFVNASHDIRAALTGIKGLIEISYNEVARGSELATNLGQMYNCAKDLLDLLNSILDTSKIEAGKMQLQEEEFNLGQLLEEVVDLYHPVAMKRGVDVVLDPHNGSVIKFSNVKADRTKLRQILWNLLSNAVKFTSEGHVSVRAWVEKPSSSGNPTLASSKRSGWLQDTSCLFYKNKKARNDLEAVNAAQRNKNTMDFVFEVDDTGKGIPKEKRKSVFENYVQVKEEEQGGTGLGLGIVQSLVRLMGGDIDIVDKEHDERGTRFRFNVLLTVLEPSSIDNSKGDTEMGGDSTSGGTELPNLGLRISVPSPGLSIRNPSPRLNICSPRPEGSKVVLLIANEERRRMTQKFMESLGINLSVVNRWQHLRSALKEMKSKFILHSPQSSLGKSDKGYKSDSSSASIKDVPLSAMEGTEHRLPVYKRRGAPSFILLVIDATAGPFSELFNAVAEFRRNLQSNCKVVWLDKPTARSINFDGLEEESLDPIDDVLLKPLHGSRLYKVIKLLPEFEGISPQGSSKHLGGKASRDTSSPYARHVYSRARSGDGSHLPRLIQGEIEEEESSGGENYKKDILPSDTVRTHLGHGAGASSAQGYRHKQKEIAERAEESGDQPRRELPLSGKRFLVADDSLVLRRLALMKLKQLGATVEVCGNGEAALNLVRAGLRAQGKYNAQRKSDAPPILPYDYILMDCEMPIMNGFEATTQIRKEEKQFGVHIPIIALTSHTSGHKADEIISAGMDIHLTKPLEEKHLLKAIEYIHSK